MPAFTVTRWSENHRDRGTEPVREQVSATACAKRGVHTGDAAGEELSGAKP
jgi:hypothetical protein